MSGQGSPEDLHRVTDEGADRKEAGVAGGRRHPESDPEAQEPARPAVVAGASEDGVRPVTPKASKTYRCPWKGSPSTVCVKEADHHGEHDFQPRSGLSSSPAPAPASALRTQDRAGRRAAVTRQRDALLKALTSFVKATVNVKLPDTAFRARGAAILVLRGATPFTSKGDPDGK